MRIIDRYGQQNATPLTSAKQSGAASPTSTSGKGHAAAPPPPSGEKVTLSAKARELSEKSAAEGAAKVEHLRAAVQSGTFKIDPQGIASKIVDGNGA